ncbi:MAG TPA: hypothetical protein VJS47_07920 [Rhizomicrobium sp.]|nr:hypothetical protein [Rhizomicrobium sp.]
MIKQHGKIPFGHLTPQRTFPGGDQESTFTPQRVGKRKKIAGEPDGSRKENDRRLHRRRGVRPCGFFCSPLCDVLGAARNMMQPAHPARGTGGRAAGKCFGGQKTGDLAFQPQRCGKIPRIRVQYLKAAIVHTCKISGSFECMRQVQSVIEKLRRIIAPDSLA